MRACAFVVCVCTVFSVTRISLVSVPSSRMLPASPYIGASGEGLILSDTVNVLCAFPKDVGSGSAVHGGCDNFAWTGPNAYKLPHTLKQAMVEQVRYGSDMGQTWVRYRSDLWVRYRCSDHDIYTAYLFPDWAVVVRVLCACGVT